MSLHCKFIGLYVSLDRARGVRGSAISGLSESLDMSWFERVMLFYRVVVYGEIYFIRIARSFF